MSTRTCDAATPPNLTAAPSTKWVPRTRTFSKPGDYYDPKSTPENPIWYAVEIKFVRKFPRVIPLAELKATRGLENMLVVQKGQRLSVMPVTPHEFEIVGRLASKAVKT